MEETSSVKIKYCFMNLLCLILNVFKKHTISKENHKTNNSFEKPSIFYVIVVRCHKHNKIDFVGIFFYFEGKAEADTNTQNTHKNLTCIDTNKRRCKITFNILYIIFV